jgi:hypothetical protein
MNFSYGPRKIRFQQFFTYFSTFRCLSQKIKKITKFSNKSLKSWPKNLSNEYKYAELNLSRTRDISFQSWLFHSQSRLEVPPKFSLWRQVPENWQVSRGFLLWLFLNLSIDYRKKVQKQNLEESLLGLSSTLFPTVACQVKALEKASIWFGFDMVNFRTKS